MRENREQCCGRRAGALMVLQMALLLLLKGRGLLGSPLFSHADNEAVNPPPEWPPFSLPPPPSPSQFMDSLSWTLLLELRQRVTPCFVVLGFRPSAHGHSRGRSTELHAVEGATIVSLGPLAKAEVRKKGVVFA